MRKQIGATFKQKQEPWARLDPHYLRLAELDALLDGEFYDCLPNSFYQDTSTGGKYVPLARRRPSFQFNMYNMVADQVARKLFAGRHAPTLVHEDEKVRKQLDALKEECKLEAAMIEAVNWGSVGSVCTIFQIVPFEVKQKGKTVKKSKVVVKNIRAKQCTPVFNKLDELSRLRIHHPVMGADYLNADEPVLTDWAGEEVKGERPYWFVQELNDQEEITYLPIPLEKWAPYQGKTPKLVPGEVVAHGLGFVPAHWHRYRTGKLRPYDGKCYWEQAIPNIIDVDYTVSLIGSGVRYNAVPQVVVKGDIVNLEQDGAVGRGANRFIQIKADIKEDNNEESNSDVKMLEAVGNAMKIGIDSWAALVIRIALQQVCASLKDPNKVTTAMSGKGMEVLESEFLDLAQELRTLFGDEGFLKLLKKIAAACAIKNHALMLDIDSEDIDGLTLAWPPLSGIGMIEVQAMAAGLVQLVGGGDDPPAILTPEEARNVVMSQLDMPVVSANKDYLLSVQKSISLLSATKPSKTKRKTSKRKLSAEDENDALLKVSEAVADAGIEQIARGQLDTHY